jgi:hypothetical protein
MVYGRGWAHTGGWVQQGGSVTPGTCVGPQPSISRHVMAPPSFILLHLSFWAERKQESRTFSQAGCVGVVVGYTWRWRRPAHAEGIVVEYEAGDGAARRGESARTDLSLGSSRLWEMKKREQKAKEKVKSAACLGRPSSSGSADLPRS